MRREFLFLLLFSSLNVMADIPSTNTVRTMYEAAAGGEAPCRALLTLLTPFNEHNNAVLAGYRGCATMLMANYVFNPLRKYSNFATGKKMLEKSIHADISNIELRFLRFTVQTSAPSFLGYCNAINQDKSVLLKAIPAMNDYMLKEMIIGFLKQSTYLTSAEKRMLEKS